MLSGGGNGFALSIKTAKDTKILGREPKTAIKPDSPCAYIREGLLLEGYLLLSGGLIFGRAYFFIFYLFIYFFFGGGGGVIIRILRYFPTKLAHSKWEPVVDFFVTRGRLVCLVYDDSVQATGNNLQFC